MAFRNAFITGASSGIGRAIALELARRGTRVVVTARRLELLEELVAEIARDGGRADAEVLDVRDSKAVAESIARWDEHVGGGIDLVLANSGLGRSTSVSEMTWEDVDDVIDVNVRGAMVTLVEGVRVMLPRRRGTVAGVSSLAGVRAMPSGGVYPASKAALQSFIETLQIELHGSGLTAIDIQPGWVRTPMVEGIEHPMPFLVEVEDAALRCVEALERGQPVLAFPWQLAWPLKTIGRMLPRSAWAWVARRVKGKE